MITVGGELRCFFFLFNDIERESSVGKVVVI